MSYVIKADMKNYPKCIDDENGIYVDKSECNYTTLRKAKRYTSYAEAKSSITEEWEIVEEVK